MSLFLDTGVKSHVTDAVVL